MKLANLLLALSHSLTLATAAKTRYPDSDYVIVGAGPAGYVLANRLSQDPNITVILLEAGSDGSDNADIYTPGHAGKLQNSRYSWNYTSQPDPRRGGIAPRFPQGRGLGGGTSINFMAYSRGAASVYDQWAKESGNDRLSFGKLLQMFQLSTNLTMPSLTDYPTAANPAVYGNGPLQVSYEMNATETEPFWGDAMATSISPTVPLIDPTDGRSIGRVNGGPHTINLKTGRRSSAQNSYGSTLLARKNVRVITGAEATKIHVWYGKAALVEYISGDGSNLTVWARREVIVSAGAIGSPKLLMLSGIGPRKHLEDLRIPVVKDIPDVGDHLHDHHNAVVMVQIPDNITTSYRLQSNATLLAVAEEQFQANGTGPLSRTLTSSYVTERPPDAFLDTINAPFHKALPKDRPILSYHYTTSAMAPNPQNANVISGYVSLIQPEAHGSVRLASNDYRDAPLIFSNYWGSDADLALQLYGYKKLRGAMASKIMAPIVKGELFPGPKVQTDDELTRAMLSSAWSFHHPSGTCALGKVVDSKFRIPGIRGLRIVDSSVLPSQPTCHTSAPVYAVAELAAQMIQEDWNRARNETVPV
ncbi:hypothetical protein ASPSYDRAFT_59546 [Aspergillus sydowii CBS 593.65]|uniref:Glucose-methanol-choline oxidoreductase N-terminal domain-containing protein n=1 Tax=Aspergillus sydowii CBS 593.65 TaxID=1036612 RepID=A0A1L9TCL1_9EURO|nr:uncharacterized protein ASPSYDRAFT_59546 [Aspergillus sydowii CBS 593.65]OJJ57157.1 hypothetical protein ASPSYDRAFT_59546 [Aspergillus sydowii CBS 593.65]